MLPEPLLQAYQKQISILSSMQVLDEKQPQDLKQKDHRNDGETYTLDSRGSSDAVCAPDAAFRVRASTGISRELDSNRFRAVGNAVAVPIVEWLGKRIVLVDQQVSQRGIIVTELLSKRKNDPSIVQGVVRPDLLEILQMLNNW